MPEQMDASLKIDPAKLAKENLTIKVHFVRLGRFLIRLRVGAWFIRFGCWVVGLGYVQTESDGTQDWRVLRAQALIEKELELEEELFRQCRGAPKDVQEGIITGLQRALFFLQSRPTLSDVIGEVLDETGEGE